MLQDQNLSVVSLLFTLHHLFQFLHNLQAVHFAAVLENVAAGSEQNAFAPTATAHKTAVKPSQCSDYTSEKTLL